VIGLGEPVFDTGGIVPEGIGQEKGLPSCLLYDVLQGLELGVV